MSPDSADNLEARADAGEEAEVLRAALDVCSHLELVDQLRELLGHGVAWGAGEMGFAFLTDDESGALVCRASTLALSDRRRTGLQRLDPAPVWERVSGEETLFSDLSALVPLDEPLQKLLPSHGIALRVEARSAEPVGLVLLLGPAPPGVAARERVRRLMHLTRRGVANAIHVRAVQELVIKDDTAECFNRRYFEDFLLEEIARASRFQAPLSLIFFDMDNLKEVNSRLGHAMGSRSLYEISVRVRARIRKFDKLFRFGGDEFCIVLPMTDWHGALEVAERVRESIAAKPFLTTQTAGQSGVRMTASFGIASFPLHARAKEDLVQRADRAMQRIKAGTKNSIAIAEIVREDREP